MRCAFLIQGRHLLVAAAYLLCCSSSSFCADEIRFNEHIRPILVEYCWQCHGPDDSQRSAELRLDTENGAKASVIVAGDPDRSSFMQRIISAHSGTDASSGVGEIAEQAADRLAAELDPSRCCLPRALGL